MKRILYLLSFAVLAGCGQNEPQRPKDLLPESKMVQVLADVHIAEARIENHIVYPDTALMVYNAEQKRILEAYGIDEQEFKRTYQYYARNIGAMDRLYEIILDTLSVREARLRASDTTGRAPGPERNTMPSRSVPPAGLKRGM